MVLVPHIEALLALGMTPIEAAVYEHLIQSDAATGYRIAHGIDKPTANTYKALASLEEKGAVAVEPGDRRLYRAVAPDELLNALERRFMDNRRAAAAGLSSLARVRGGDGVYQLRTYEQVVERLRKMLSRCRRSAVLDLSPTVATAVASELEFAADTGARVVIKVYDGEEFVGVRCVPAVAETQPEGEHAAVAVVDGREMLLAALDSDGTSVRRAVWTVHRDVSRILHRALVAELLFTDIEGALSDGISTDELEETFEAYRELRVSPTTG